jgi:hypothetical protein
MKTQAGIGKVKEHEMLRWGNQKKPVQPCNVWQMTKYLNEHTDKNIQ